MDRSNKYSIPFSTMSLFFVQKIIFGSCGDEYLFDDRVRDMFIGDHLEYDFEHCRKVLLYLCGKNKIYATLRVLVCPSLMHRMLICF